MAMISKQTACGLTGGGAVGTALGLVAGASLSCGVEPGHDAAPAFCDTLEPLVLSRPAKAAMRAYGAFTQGCASVLPQSLYVTRLSDKAADFIAASRGHIEDGVPWANERALITRLPHTAYPTSCDFDAPAAHCPDPLAYLRAERLAPWVAGASCLAGVTTACAFVGVVTWSWYPQTIVVAADAAIVGVDLCVPGIGGRALLKRSLMALRDQASANVERLRVARQRPTAVLDTGDTASIETFHTAPEETTLLLHGA